jgi:hypothetical protein
MEPGAEKRHPPGVVDGKDVTARLRAIEGLRGAKFVFPPTLSQNLTI